MQLQSTTFSSSCCCWRFVFVLLIMNMILLRSSRRVLAMAGTPTTTTMKPAFLLLPSRRRSSSCSMIKPKSRIAELYGDMFSDNDNDDNNKTNQQQPIPPPPPSHNDDNIDNDEDSYENNEDSSSSYNFNTPPPPSLVDTTVSFNQKAAIVETITPPLLETATKTKSETSTNTPIIKQRRPIPPTMEYETSQYGNDFAQYNNEDNEMYSVTDEDYDESIIDQEFPSVLDVENTEISMTTEERIATAESIMQQQAPPPPPPPKRPIPPTMEYESSPYTSDVMEETNVMTPEDDDTNVFSNTDSTIKQRMMNNQKPPSAFKPPASYSTTISLPSIVDNNNKEDGSIRSSSSSSSSSSSPPSFDNINNNIPFTSANTMYDSDIRSITNVSEVQEKLQQIQNELYTLNNNTEFNINSPQQASMALFGLPKESTNKDELEAIASGVSVNSSLKGGTMAQMAKGILNYRKTLRWLKRLQKQQEQQQSSNSTTVQHTQEDAFVLVDASAYIFRAYYSMPPIHRYDGEPVGALLGFCNMLNRLIDVHKNLVLVFDAKGSNLKRKEMYSDYKANRKPCPPDLIPQFDFIKDACDAYGIVQVEANGYEADDVIATLANKAALEKEDSGKHVYIYSGDKDLYQLASNEITIIDPMTMEHVTPDKVEEKWGVTPNQLGDVLALAGDTADNIPGVRGIGKKIAVDLIQQFGTLDKLLENLDSIPQTKRRENLIEDTDMARLSRELVELEKSIPLNQISSMPTNIERVSDIRMEPLNQDRLLQFFKMMGLKDMQRRMKAKFASSTKKATTPLMDKYHSTFVPNTSTTKASVYNTTTTNESMNESLLSKENHGEKRKITNLPNPEDFKDVPF